MDDGTCCRLFESDDYPVINLLNFLPLEKACKVYGSVNEILDNH